MYRTGALSYAITFWLLFLKSVHGLVATPDDVRNVERQATSALCQSGVPCGYWTPYWAQFCCAEGQFCTTDVYNVARCTDAATLVVVITTAEGQSSTIVNTIISTSSPATRSITLSSAIATPTSQTSSAPPTVSSASQTNSTPHAGGVSKTVTIGAGVGVGVGAVIILAGLIWCLCAKSYRKRKDVTQRQEGGNGGADSGLARVEDRPRSKGQLAQMRREAAEQVRAASYNNDGPNPFGPEGMARSQSQGFDMLNGPDSVQDNNVQPAGVFSSHGRSQHSVPRRPLHQGGGQGPHVGIRSVPQPPSFLGDLRPDHDPRRRAGDGGFR